MRKRLVVANWKMYLNLTQGRRLVDELDKHVSASTKVEVVLCPSYTLLEPLKTKLEPLKFKLGAQNCYLADEGPFTGEVSPAQLQGLAEYVIIGHSERRLKFNETNDIIARKVGSVVRNGLAPIICVGENLFERQDSETSRVIHDQLTAGLVMLTADDIAQAVIAYEPVWAIGTGEVAKPEQVRKAMKLIRKTVKGLYGKTAADNIRILYGGSVKPDFVPGFLQIKELDGFLVGGASLNYHEFADIIKLAQSKDRQRRVAKTPQA